MPLNLPRSTGNKSKLTAVEYLNATVFRRRRPICDRKAGVSWTRCISTIHYFLSPDRRNLTGSSNATRSLSSRAGRTDRSAGTGTPQRTRGAGIEKDPQRRQPSNLHFRHSLELLQQLGVSDAFVNKGTGLGSRGRSYYKDQQIYPFW